MPVERGLSIRQPFAWAICTNLKRYENRTWTTHYRGTIAIHASAGESNVNQLLKDDEQKLIDKHYFEFGAIIGLADVVDIQSYGPMHESNSFASGPYCWQMANGRLFDKPIPMKGKLNLFKLPKDIQDQIQSAACAPVDLSASPTAALIADLMSGECDPVGCYHDLLEEYANTGNHIEAVKVAAQRLVELTPDDAYCYNARGFLLWTPETTGRSLADYRKATELDPMFEPAWSNFVNTLSHIQDWEQLYSMSEQYVRHFPQSSLAFEQHARALYWLHRYPEALASADQAVQLAADSAIAWALRAEIKRELSDYDGARVDISQAIKLAPEEDCFKEIEKTIFCA